MKKLLQILVLVLLLYSETYGQEVFFKTGKNFTTYEFKSYRREDIKFLPGRGDSYEFGLGFPFSEKGGTDPTLDSSNTSIPTWLRYEVSLTMDSFDSYGGNLTNNYSWETTYGGVRNRLAILKRVGGLELSLMGILGVSKMINGTQVLNQSRFDLREFKDFSGVLFERGLGASASFEVVNQGFLSLSYDYSSSFRLVEFTPDRFRFNNQRVVFGIHFKLD